MNKTLRCLGGEHIDESQIPHWYSMGTRKNERLQEAKSVTPSPSCFSSAVQKEAGGKAEGCSAHPQHSRGIVRTWEFVPWVALSQRLIFTAHSYFSQGAAEVQASPDKVKKKKSRS